MVYCLIPLRTNCDRHLNKCENPFFDHKSSGILYRAKKIAESERSEAEQGVARYKIPERVGSKNGFSYECNGDHSEFLMVLNM